MKSFEQEFREYLLRNPWMAFVDNTGSMSDLDFTLVGKRSTFHVEIKEKRQPIRTDYWGNLDIPERYQFILDDLSARKVLGRSPNSGLLVRAESTYILFTVLDLFSMPKVRFNRTLRPGKTEQIKGKWVIDLRSGTVCPNLDCVLLAIGEYIAIRTELFSVSPCVGTFKGETIQSGGTPRTQAFKRHDFSATR